MEQYFFPLVYSSQEGLIYILLNISQTNSLEPQIPNKLDPGEWTTILTHKNDPQVWFTRMIHDIDPRVWPTRPTRMTHEFNPRVWPTRMTHEFDPRVRPTTMIHEFDSRDWPTRSTWPTRFGTLIWSYCTFIFDKYQTQDMSISIK